MKKLDRKELKNKLIFIGSKSLQLIEEHRSNKGKSWDLAVKINATAHNLYERLEKEPYFLTNERLDEEEMWDEYLLWCREQENCSHEG